MAIFTGTDGADTIRPGFLSAGVSANPPGAVPEYETPDTIYGNGGDDILGAGNGDTLYGGTGNDELSAGDGSDVLYGEDGNDSLDGDREGQHVLYGGDGNDHLYGSYLYAGSVTLIGGSGDDHYSNFGTIIELPGGGIDTLDIWDGGGTLPAEVENLNFTSVSGTETDGIGNDKDNVIRGSDYDIGLFGLSGNDTLLAAAFEHETLDGGTGADSMVGSEADSTYVVDNARDIVRDVAPYRDSDGTLQDGGHDLVKSSISYTLGDYIEDLTLTGAARSGTGNGLANLLTGNGSANLLSGLGGDDSLYGGGGNDTLTGGAGNDALNGETGADRMSGEGGNDIYYVDNAADKVVEATAGGAGGIDIVYARVSFTLGANVESLRMIPGSGAINGTGNGSGNELWGTSDGNSLRGMAGADSVDGGGGADVLIGGTGNDVFLYKDWSTSTPASRDRIQGGDGAAAFEKPGAALGDRFDFSKMDANSEAAGQQHFVFGTSHAIGHLWAVTSGTDTLIRGNVDGDSTVEFELAIADGATSHTAYTAADFIL